MNLRKTVVYPEVVKTLNNGQQVIAYHWHGAELAQIGDHAEAVLPDWWAREYGILRKNS